MSTYIISAIRVIDSITIYTKCFFLQHCVYKVVQTTFAFQIRAIVTLAEYRKGRYLCQI